MKQIKSSAVLAFILTAGITFSGCGGGSSSTSVGTTGSFTFTSPASANVNTGVSRAIDVDAVDPDGNSVTYALSGADADKFSIDSNGVVNFKVGAAEGVYNIIVTALAGGKSITQNITITVTAPPNHAPTIVSAATASVAENQLNAIDIDATDSDADAITYSINGGDSASFTIDPTTGVVVFNSAPDFETKNSYTFTATASDGVANTTQNITITITDVAEGSAPVITTPSTVSVDENQKSAVDIDATDIDGDTIVYSIEGGADGGSFDINSSTGVVTFKVAPDYETKNSYTLTVGASDATATTTKDITISINDLQGGSLVFKTGQTLKYLAGDDGDYQYGLDRNFTSAGMYINNPPFLFIDSRILTENTTGLVWRNDDYMTSKNYQDAANYCNSLSYNFQTDWRLPTIDELTSIANRGTENYFGSFNNIKTDEYYWSGTPYNREANKHYTFSFKLGNDSTALDTSTKYVTCVRKDVVLTPIFPFQPRFTRPGIFLGGDVITDSKTKLQWFDPTNNFGFPILLTPASGTWTEAIEGCNNLSADGKSDWRLPNINELLTIVDRSKNSGNAFYDIFDTVAADTYFSSTTRQDDPTKAWGVNFATGLDAATALKTTVKKYRCVRSLGD